MTAIIVAVIALGGTTVYIIRRQEYKEVANWKIYKNEKYGFEFKHPQNWHLAEVNWKDFPPRLLVIYLNDKPIIMLERNPPIPVEPQIITFSVREKGGCQLSGEEQGFNLGEIKGFLKLEKDGFVITTELKKNAKCLLMQQTGVIEILDLE